MLNDLEKYLENNRDSLDVEQPDEAGIWEGIRKELQDGGKNGRNKVIWIQIRNIAAAAIIFLSIGYFISELRNNKLNNPKITLATLNHDLGEREKEYMTMVRFKKKEIAEFAPTDKLEIQELFEEIDLLDEIYKQCLKDLVEVGYDERVINTIFDTYEQKIFLLELIILEYNKTDTYETDETLTL